MPDMDCVSSLVQLGDFFYVSGQNGKGETFHDQCLYACYAFQDVLSEFHLRFDHVLKFTVYLCDITLRDEFLRVYENFAEQPWPALTVVESPNLPDGSMVCIEGCGVNTLRHERPHDGSYCEDCDE